ncbi:ELKS/Rab6-interacting/CAST family member 1-like [Aphidius gifuensis]|nr:ELKS/Rab6-interacting/CAST family member 1-like [Aphidius gifuensis]
MPLTFLDDELIIDDDNKIKELNYTIKDKNNKIQQHEKQVNELQIEINFLTKNMEKMQNELTEYEAEDIGVLKEEIRVRDEKIQQLENEIESLEHTFSERFEDLDHIEELVNMIKEKEEREYQLVIELGNEKEKNNELTEALRESIKISSQEQNKSRSIEKTKRNALTRIDELEQRITSMQSASAIKCYTCQSLLQKLADNEKKLDCLTRERMIQLKELHQIKREALRATLSEKDAHLALLELPSIEKQSIQAEKLRKDKEKIIEQLKNEDKKYMELSEESESSSSSTDNPPLLTSTLEPSDNYGNL